VSESSSQYPLSAHESSEATVRHSAPRSTAELPAQAAVVSQPRKWSRARTVWLLIAIALVPAAAAGQLFGGWDRLSQAMQWAIIAIGAGCTVAVVYLMLTSD
jgi:hypothetical protein